LSMTEIEEMKFDPDCNCELTKADLTRISKLPDQVSFIQYIRNYSTSGSEIFMFHQVNLALPFLHTPDEVDAHRILNTFLKEIPEKVFIQRDYESDGVVPEISEQSKDVSSSDLHDAEVVHDILVRESLRDHIRSKGEGDGKTLFKVFCNGNHKSNVYA